MAKVKEDKKPKAKKAPEIKGKTIILYNKSKSVYNTHEGAFLPGTSKKFSEMIAMRLLQSGGDIVRASDYSKLEV